MKKSDRIQQHVKNLQKNTPKTPYSPFYENYFTHFDATEYYEAHDILEHLWLHETDTQSPHWPFYKGLIQLAGAYVHLKKHHYRPHHYKFATRLHPAARLFRLASQNLAPSSPSTLGLDVQAIEKLIADNLSIIQNSHYTTNPWTPQKAPLLTPMRNKP
ncbi:MAG: DUF309 domain-containing protein [Chthoniobacterales bacterium]